MILGDVPHVIVVEGVGELVGDLRESVAVGCVSVSVSGDGVECEL